MYVISPTVSPRFVKKPLTKDWHSKVAEIPFAVGLSSLSFYCLFVEDNLLGEPLWGSSPLVQVGAGLVCGCMMADLLYDVRSGLFRGDYALHHAIAISYCVATLSSGTYSYYLFLFGITELSTVFLNLSWLCKFVGYKKSSTLFVFNAIAYTASSFLTRVVPVPLGVYRFFYLCPNVEPQPAFIVTVIMGFDLVVMNALNICWFYYLVVGLKKILIDLKSSSANEMIDLSMQIDGSTWNNTSTDGTSPCHDKSMRRSMGLSTN